MNGWICKSNGDIKRDLQSVADSRRPGWVLRGWSCHTLAQGIVALCSFFDEDQAKSWSVVIHIHDDVAQWTEYQ